MFFLNPFVYDRMLAGHVGLLLGYTLLPLFVLVWIPDPEGDAKAAIMGGILLAALAALSPHFVFLGGLLILLVVAGAVFRRDRPALGRAALSALTSTLLCAYWLVPGIKNIGLLKGVTADDLHAFRTVADPQLGLFANTAGLYGFWHQEWPLPKDGLPGWWVLMLAMSVVICVGAWLGMRDPERRQVSLTLVISGVVGFFLALGDRGPTGHLFLWMFNHVPGFRIMREPQKFLVLLVLAYAFFYGIGSEWLIKGFKSKWAKGAMAVLLIALPCIYTYKMFWGFNGYVKPSKFPESWAQADKLMGDGPEKALALPWHLYMAFPWTQDRLVANPMSSYFRRETIVGDNIELGEIESQSTNPRSRYIEETLMRGNQVTRAGNLLAPIGVRYILLAKEQDWQDYRWLEGQKDLRLVKEWPDLRLYENMLPAPQMYSVDSVATFRDMGELVQAAESVTLTDYAVRIDPSVPARDVPPSVGHEVPSVERSPVRYEVGRTTPGRFLVLSEPFDPDWEFRGQRAFANLGATNAFEASPAGGTEVFYTRWPLVRLGYIISGSTLLLLLGYLVVSRWKNRVKVGESP